VSSIASEPAGSSESASENAEAANQIQREPSEYGGACEEGCLPTPAGPLAGWWPDAATSLRHESRILVENPALERLQRRTRLEPELVD